MIIDDEEVAARRPRSPPHGSSGSTMSMSPFPPRGHHDHSFFNSAARDHNHGSTSPTNPSTEALLPYAFRHAQPHAFEQYPGGNGAGGGWDVGVGPWRARGMRVRLLLIIAGASLIFLLHDHFFRPRGGPHRPPPWGHGPPPFFPPPPHHPPDGLEQFPPPPPAPPLNAPPADQRPPIAANPPPPVVGAADLAEPTSKTDPDLPPIDDITSYIQPRRKIRPASPDPWSDLPPSWPGRHWLAAKRFPTSGTTQQGLTDPPERTAPPARYLMKAFEYAADVGKRLKGKGAMDGIRQPVVAYDEGTGRPLKIKHEVLASGTAKSWSGHDQFRIGDLNGKEKRLPVVQWEGAIDDGEEMHPEEREEEEEQRRAWVKRAFLHAWEGYKEHAWGHDELMPVSNLWSNNYNGWGATIVDNLDTLLIMGLSSEYNLARQHVSDIDFTFLVPSGAKTFSTKLPKLEDLELLSDEADSDTDDLDGGHRFVNPRLLAAMNQHSPSTIPTFETAIRYLGGFISAYDLSGDPLMLERAIEMGDWLLPALNTKHGLAVGRYTIGSNPEGLQIGQSVLAEVGSLTLEFAKLSVLSGNEVYYQAVQRSMDTLDKGFIPAADRSNAKARLHGRLGTLLPSYVDPVHPGLVQGEYTFGGLADSYYEYLIKAAQLLSDATPQYSRMYSEAMDSAHEFLIRPVKVVPGRDDLTAIGVAAYGQYSATMDHLTCFAGGMLGLGSRLLGREKDFETGVNVTEACVWAYESSATGIGPESLTFFNAEEPSRYQLVDAPDGVGQVRKPRGKPIGVKSSNSKALGRPETIESVFYMWRLTGDRKWQDKGWNMFTSWVEHAITESGFASINDVHARRPKKQDSMESFVLAETLKYYYLLFSPRDLISLDDYVFNTEAHPFLIPKSSSTTPPLLWTGPSRDSPPIDSFVSTAGQGTWVQKWARVQQAAVLAQGKNIAMMNAAAAKIPERPPAHRDPVRPSEEEMEKARKKAAGRVEKDEEATTNGEEGLEGPKKKEEPKRPVMGGGRGMGGMAGGGRGP